jgi:DNA-binding phage protein
MSKVQAFNAAKYRSNPKAIANYLNDALATDDSALSERLAISRAPTEWGPLPKRRT